MTNLYYEALNRNDFGLRQRFPWKCEHPKAPWMSRCVSRRERSYIFSYMEDLFYWDEMYVERVENPYLWGQYVLRYEEMKSDHASRYVAEDIVIHATSDENAYEIADNNFNWRLASRCRYGQGVSFARDAEYAEAQATENEVYIVTGVLVANSEIGNYKTKIPSYDSDTTMNRQESVCVKYNDNEYYPYYVVY